MNNRRDGFSRLGLGTAMESSTENRTSEIQNEELLENQRTTQKTSLKRLLIDDDVDQESMEKNVKKDKPPKKDDCCAKSCLDQHYQKQQQQQQFLPKTDSTTTTGEYWQRYEDDFTTDNNNNNNKDNENIINNSMKNQLTTPTTTTTTVQMQRGDIDGTVEYLFHIADIHILLRNHDHIAFAWEHLIQRICSIPDYETKVILVIAGDIFDNKLYLKASDIHLFHSMLSLLESAKIETVIICGNHDFNADRPASSSSPSSSEFFSQNNQHEDKILAIMERMQYRYIFYYPQSCIVLHKNINFHIFSPIDNKKATSFLEQQKQNIVLGKQKSNGFLFKVAVAHTILTEAKAMSPMTTLTNSRNYGSSSFSIHDFAPFYDAVLLGAVHQTQRLAKNVVYPGSFVQKTRLESHVNGCVIWHLRKNCTPEFVALPQLSVYLRIFIEKNQPPKTPLLTKLDPIPVIARGVQLYHTECSDDFVRAYQQVLLKQYPEIQKLDGTFCRNPIVSVWTEKNGGKYHQQTLKIMDDETKCFLKAEESQKTKQEEDNNKATIEEQTSSSSSSSIMLIKSEINNLLNRKLETLPDVEQRKRIVSIHDHLFGSLLISSPSLQNRHWCLRWISWKGIGCYGEEENYFNLDDLSNLNSIVGKNKIGKSTLLEIITIALFNRCINNGSKIAYLNEKCKQHYIKCCVSVKKMAAVAAIETYEIEHYWDEKQKEQICIFKDGTLITDCHGKAETNQYIENNIVGPYIVFENTVIASQERKSLVKMTAQQRYDFIAQIAGLDKLREAEKQNISQMNSLQKKQKTMSVDAHYLQVENLRESYRNKELNLKKKTALLENAIEILQELEKKKDSLLLSAHSSSSDPNEIALQILALSHEYATPSSSSFPKDHHNNNDHNDDTNNTCIPAQCPIWDKSFEEELDLALHSQKLEQKLLEDLKSRLSRCEIKMEELKTQFETVHERRIRMLNENNHIPIEFPQEMTMMISSSSFSCTNRAEAQTQYEQYIKQHGLLQNEKEHLDEQEKKTKDCINVLSSSIEKQNKKKTSLSQKLDVLNGLILKTQSAFVNARTSTATTPSTTTISKSDSMLSSSEENNEKKTIVGQKTKSSNKNNICTISPAFSFLCNEENSLSCEFLKTQHENKKRDQNFEYILQLQGQYFEHTQFLMRFKNVFENAENNTNNHPDLQQIIRTFIECENMYKELLHSKVKKLMQICMDERNHNETVLGPLESELEELEQKKAYYLQKQKDIEKSIKDTYQELHEKKVHLQEFVFNEKNKVASSFEQNQKNQQDAKNCIILLDLLEIWNTEQTINANKCNLLTDIQALQSEIKSVEEKLQITINKIEKHQKQKMDHKAYKRLNNALKQAIFARKSTKELQDVKEEYAFIRSNFEKNRETKNMLETELAIVQIQIKQAENETMISEKENEQLMDHQLYNKFINHKDGIAHERMAQLCTDIQLRCNAIFTEVADFTIELAFSKKIELFIVNNTTNVRVYGEHACGYERFIVDVVLRQVICSIIGNGIPKILFLDEGFGSADEENLDILCRNVFPILTHEFEKVIVISHVPKVHEFTMLNCDIIVNPRTGTSKLQFGTFPKNAHVLQSFQTSAENNNNDNNNDLTSVTTKTTTIPISRKKKQNNNNNNEEDESIVPISNNNNSSDPKQKSKFFECLACKCKLVNAYAHRSSAKHTSNLKLFLQEKKIKRDSD